MGCWPHRRILCRQRWGALGKVQGRGWVGEPTVTVNKLLCLLSHFVGSLVPGVFAQRIRISNHPKPHGCGRASSDGNVKGRLGTFPTFL